MGRLLPHPPNERPALLVHLFAAREKVPPHPRRRRQLRQRPPERLDRQPPVVIRLPQRLEVLRPWHVPGPRRPTVVFAHVIVNHLPRHLAIRPRRVLLLDVGVERVEHHPQARVVHLLHERRRVPRRRQ